jgi:hypothetical protein
MLLIQGGGILGHNLADTVGLSGLKGRRSKGINPKQGQKT